MTTSLLQTLRERFAAAVQTVAGADRDPIIKPSGDPKFGDYQCNVAMSLAKPLGAKPRDIAQRIIDAVAVDDLAESLEIAGPGFINIRLKDAALAERLLAASTGWKPMPEDEAVGSTGGKPVPHEGTEEPSPGPSLEGRGVSGRGSETPADRLGIEPVAAPQTIVIDYSSPNIAKQMHVGHLRSTIIGDVAARVLGFFGHKVIRQNHVGDWGTQFGMLITWYTTAGNALPDPSAPDVLGRLEADYRAAAARFKEDTAFAEQARAAVGRLQGGDAEARQVWERLCALSRSAFVRVYERLGVLLTDANTCGESFYNDRLADVVALLRQRLAAGQSPRARITEDAGAQCIFLYDDAGEPAYKNPDGDALPMIVQKSDGAFLYATTDLAALQYRVRDLRADRIIYVTDARQKMHFEMLFAAGRAAGLAEPETRLDHVTFGSVLGDDRKPLKTRSGDNVKLEELLDESERRAAALLAERAAAAERDSESAPADIAADAAAVIGIGAVKYADLRNDRNTDYVFDWDKLLAFTGNTAPYMLYAYARVRSIYRKAAERLGPEATAGTATPTLAAPEERALALRLCRLRETLDSVAEDLLPHVLCGYLYDVAGDFMRFYESCPVLDAPNAATRRSRLELCDLTARTLRLGLGLLGIETVERM
jgi:arginyl-tRNA synthetase